MDEWDPSGHLYIYPRLELISCAMAADQARTRSATSVVWGLAGYGFINGVLMTGMMVFHPDWIRSFDAQGYIDQQ